MSSENREPTDATVDERLMRDFERATRLRNEGNLSGARSLLEELARIYPTAFPVWLVLGGIQMDQCDYESAERSLSMATALKARSELASIALFHALKNLDRTDDAFAEMRRFLSIRPESDEYQFLLREMDGDVGRG